MAWEKINLPAFPDRRPNKIIKFPPIYLARRDQFTNTRLYYCASMVALYLLFCVIGSQRSGLIVKLGDTTIFSLVGGLSQGPINIFERHVRQFWHRQARIPVAAQELASNLQTADFNAPDAGASPDLDRDLFPAELVELTRRANYIIESLRDTNRRQTLVNIEFFSEYVEEWDAIG
jgi:hypothetical protein